MSGEKEEGETANTTTTTTWAASSEEDEVFCLWQFHKRTVEARGKVVPFFEREREKEKVEKKKWSARRDFFRRKKIENTFFFRSLARSLVDDYTSSLANSNVKKEERAREHLFVRLSFPLTHTAEYFLCLLQRKRSAG